MGRSPRVAVIDDDPAIVEVVKTVLESKKIKVQVANNGEDGVKLIKEYKPDLIILDVQMPKLSGYMVVELLKGKKKTSKIPIILLTAVSLMAGGISLEEPTSYRLTKPFNPQELIDLVAEILAKEKLKKETRTPKTI